MAKNPGEFNPAKYVMKIKGRDYVEVKNRLMWVHDYADAQELDLSILTHLVQYNEEKQHAIFKATVILSKDQNPVIETNGYGSEDAKGFPEFLEKAETKAIGRALAAAGFGTQFVADHDFAEGTDRVVDSPVAPKPANTTVVIPPFNLLSKK